MSELYKIITLTIILATFFFACFSQSIHIKSQTISPLPYASVLNVSKGGLHFANEMGALSGDFEIGDSIFITHVGYKDLRSRITDVNQTFLFYYNSQN